MKTPREILLEEHREAETELDAIRRRVINQACQRAEDRLPASIANWGRLLWTQLFVPSRPAWLSLAAAWVFVAALSLARFELSSAGIGPSSAKQTLLHLKPLMEEQTQLRVELLQSGNAFTPTEASVGEATDPGPLSDRRSSSNDDATAGERVPRPAGIDDRPVG